MMPTIVISAHSGSAVLADEVCMFRFRVVGANLRKIEVRMLYRRERSR
jgi:hypothetical protein